MKTISAKDTQNTLLSYYNEESQQQLVSQDSQHSFEIRNPEQKPKSQQQKRNFGHFSSDTWFIGDDAQLLQQKYDFLLKTRLSLQQIRNLSNKFVKEQHSDSKKKPSLLSTSQSFSSSSKVVQIDLKRQTHSPLARVDLLVQQNILQKKRHAEIKRQTTDKELDGCCFQPNLDRCEDRIRANPSIGVHKSLNLFTNSSKLASMKRDKTTFDLEYEKQCDECTFHPDISLTKSPSRHTRSSQSTSQDRFYEKTVNRMRQARQDAHNTSVQLQRGYNNKPCYQIASQIQSKKSDSLFSSTNQFRTFDNNNNQAPFFMKSAASDEAPAQLNQSVEELVNDSSAGRVATIPTDRRNPVLFVDVNIDPEKSERIIICEGDEASDLAKDFSTRHNLDDKMTQKLEQMLLSQMATLIEKQPSTQHIQ